ncbi:MAG: hypothetical protein WCK09_14830, partial [Bacteroidota bacterium]
YLIFLEIEFKFSHDLVYLIELIGVKDNSLADFFNRILICQNAEENLRHAAPATYWFAFLSYIMDIPNEWSLPGRIQQLVFRHI